MDNPNSMSVDLRKLRKSPQAAPPPAPVMPAAPPQPAQFSPPPQVKAVQTPPAAPPSGIKLPAKPKRMGAFSWKKGIIGGVIAVAVLGGGYYIYSNVWTRSPFGVTPDGSAAQSGQPAAAATTTTAPQELSEADVVAKVGALMLLPEGETPALAKVSDLSALQGQAFFTHANIGDIVLMFPKASRAILYRPQENKIIEVGPIQNATSTVQTAQ